MRFFLLDKQNPMKTNPSKIRIPSLCFGLLLCGFLSAGEAASVLWTDNGVNWGGPLSTTSGYYRPGVSSGTADSFDGLPDSGAETTPVWATTGSLLTATLNAAGNFLNITTASTEFRRYDQTTNWDASVAATVEITTRINSSLVAGATVGSLLLGNAAEYSSISMSVHTSGDLTLNSTRVTGVSAANFNTIRFTLSGMASAATSEIKAYVNNSTTPVFTLTGLSASAALNLIRFGDLSQTANQGGSMDWQAVKWVSGSAIAPVPEPASIILALGGLGVLAMRRRRSRMLV